MSGVLRAFTIGLTAFLTVVDLFATQAILPALDRGLRRHAGGHGVRRQCQHHRHGGRRPGRRPVWPVDRPAARHPGQPRSAVDPDGASGHHARPADLHRCCASSQGLCMSTAFALTLAYLGEHTSAADTAERLRRLYHRQRRLQPVRPAARRGRRRSLRAGCQFLGLRRPQSFGRACWSGSPSSGRRRCRRRT